MTIEDNEARTLAAEISRLEESFCNPMKLRLARENREQLAEKGYSAAEIGDLVKESASK